MFSLVPPPPHPPHIVRFPPPAQTCLWLVACCGCGSLGVRFPFWMPNRVWFWTCGDLVCCRSISALTCLGSADVQINFWDKIRYLFWGSIVGIHGTSRGAMANEMDDKISWPEPRRKLSKERWNHRRWKWSMKRLGIWVRFQWLCWIVSLLCWK